LSNVLPEPPEKTKEQVTEDSPALFVETQKPAETPRAEEESPENDDDGDDDDDDDDDGNETDESIPGEPIEAKWARAARRKEQLAKQRRRAEKARKRGVAEVVSEHTCAFEGLQRPNACPETDGCFDRQFFLVHSFAAVEEAYDISISLGKGTFGTVERCTNRKTNEVRAVKSIPKKKVYNQSRLAQEVEIMRLLEHPSILRLYETYEDSKFMYIIMELCAGGELFEKIVAVDGGGFPELVVAKLMGQIAGAVFYMHEQRIAHRDLKPVNFLLMSKVEDMEDAVLKLIDFGFSTRFEPGTFMLTRTGTYAYIAPEVLQGRYTHACDVWSLGVILYLMLSGAQPFFSNNEGEVLAKVSSCAYDFSSSDWSLISEEAKTLIRRILVTDTATRLTAEQVVHDHWLKRSAHEAADAALPLSDVLPRLRRFVDMGKFKKAALTVIAQQLSEDSVVTTLRKVFENLDKNCDGCLAGEEVSEGFRKVGYDFAAGDLQQILQSLDTDGSGVVEYPEFMAAMLASSCKNDGETCHIVQDHACLAAFNVFDRDRDGKITRDEMSVMLSCGRVQSFAAMEEADVADVERAIVEADKDGDGCISLEDFLAFLRDIAD
jgi:calcium-dependent protein kinase